MDNEVEIMKGTLGIDKNQQFIDSELAASSWGWKSVGRRDMARGGHLKSRFLEELSLLMSWGSGVCLYVYVHVCMFTCTCHGSHLKVRGQLLQVRSSVLPSCGS